MDYIKQLEGKVISEFADTKRRFDCEKEILKKLKKERLDLVSRLNGMKGPKLCTANVSAYFLYINYIKHKEKYYEEVISRIARELEEKRLELLNVIKKRRILEMVREKKLEEYRMCLISKERKELDELGTSRYARNMKIEKIDNCV
ncbi:MAG: flagellar FliJ family protein [Deltaproteobacteria bacterium]|nr:flagellar FliJ family protein [Deltaproteobacteria bacterium]MBW1718878.1 flagellar FliJ family protein [Deltaproteobacteria bacterium]MBW1938185.1 flagellar FliJ family protein [Deltaproteobacteria bacterium]